MKSQLLKLYFAALVIGIIGVGSAFAQQNLTFSVPFDFEIGKVKFDAGKYEIRVLDNTKYVLRNLETKESKVFVSDSQVGVGNSIKSETLVFNRYGERYFLREIYAKRGNAGRGFNESKTEKNLRDDSKDDNLRIADNKSKPEKVSINSAQ